MVTGADLGYHVQAELQCSGDEPLNNWIENQIVLDSDGSFGLYQCRSMRKGNQ